MQITLEEVKKPICKMKKVRAAEPNDASVPIVFVS